MSKPKKERHLSPAGVAVYPWLTKYDDRPINGKPQKPAYKVQLAFDANNPAWLALKETLDARVEEAYAEAVQKHPKKKKLIVRQYPYKDEMDNEGEETGRVLVSFKQNAFIPAKKEGDSPTPVQMPIFDAKLRPIQKDKPVYGGSVIKVSFSYDRNYFVDSSNAAGVSLDLASVQVLKLVSSSERTGESYGFTAEEGYDGSEGDDTSDDAADNEEEAADDGEGSDPTDF